MNENRDSLYIICLLILILIKNRLQWNFFACNSKQIWDGNRYIFLRSFNSD